MSDLLLRNIIANALVEEAEKTIGIMEEGGENRGKLIEEFQRTVDGKAVQEPWCMSWLQTIVARTCARFGAKNLFPQSELCRAVWLSTPLKYRSKVPFWGSAVLWRGHCGLVTLTYKRSFNTIEGNTNQAGSREGDGVYRKTRSVTGGVNAFTILGYVDLPTMILDGIPAPIVKEST